MAQRESQKKHDTNLDEEKDFYLSYVNKKIRNIRKKLEQIDSLLKKETNTLKPEQIEKIRSRDEVLASIKYFEDMKDIYYTAYKVALEEGKVSIPERSSEATSERNGQAPEAPKAEKDHKGELDSGSINIESLKEEIITEVIRKISNLASVGHFFEDPLNKQAYSKHNQQNSFNAIVKIDELQKLHKLIFDYNIESGLVSFGDKCKLTSEKLSKYIKSSSEDTKPHNNVFELVESVANSSSFKDSLVKSSSVEEKNSNAQVETESTVNEEKHVENNTTVYENLPGAALLKPDTDDVNKSPENMKYLPKDIKTVKYVDEIEKEHMNSFHTGQTNLQSSTDTSTRQAEAETLKESVDGLIQNVSEKQEQIIPKSFRKNRAFKRDDQKLDNEERNGQSNSSSSYRKKVSNHKENKTVGDDGRGYTNNNFNKHDGYYKRRAPEYEVREYVEKKPSENKI